MVKEETKVAAAKAIQAIGSTLTSVSNTAGHVEQEILPKTNEQFQRVEFSLNTMENSIHKIYRTMVHLDNSITVLDSTLDKANVMIFTKVMPKMLKYLFPILQMITLILLATFILLLQFVMNYTTNSFFNFVLVMTPIRALQLFSLAMLGYIGLIFVREILRKESALFSEIKEEFIEKEEAVNLTLAPPHEIIVKSLQRRQETLDKESGQQEGVAVDRQQQPRELVSKVIDVSNNPSGAPPSQLQQEVLPQQEIYSTIPSMPTTTIPIDSMGDKDNNYDANAGNIDNIPLTTMPQQQMSNTSNLTGIYNDNISTAMPTTTAYSTSGSSTNTDNYSTISNVSSNSGYINLPLDSGTSNYASYDNYSKSQDDKIKSLQPQATNLNDNYGNYGNNTGMMNDPYNYSYTQQMTNQ